MKPDVEYDLGEGHTITFRKSGSAIILHEQDGWVIYLPRESVTLLKAIFKGEHGRDADPAPGAKAHKRYTKMNSLGGTKIYDENEQVFATFDVTESGVEAYGFYCEGLARRGTADLFDVDTGKYIVGDVAKLMYEPEDGGK